MPELTVRSDQFADGGDLPLSAAHPSTGGGNRSPHLAWEGEPEGTRSVAVTCWDPDAPTTVGFTHWVRIGIAPGKGSLAEGEPAGGDAGTDALTDWGDTGWGGMAPPQGDPPHRYHFTVYALDAEPGALGLDATATYAKFRFLVRGHVLASGEVVGRYAIA